MTIHKPVLLEKSLEKLNLKKGDTVIDATLGGGGHSLEILKRIFPGGKLVAIDKDKESVKRFERKLEDLKIKLEADSLELINEDFSDLNNILGDLKIYSVNAILTDFGISSDQLEDAERGFSFQKNADLDMRMDQSKQKTAQEIINTYSENDLEKVLREFGEERYARKIARAIVFQRKIKPIKKTTELVEIIDGAIPGKYRRGKKHFATKTFQALRIETNDELKNIEYFLPQAIDVLKTGGRLAVISFHSGEDRITKEIFRENARGCICPPEFPICRCGQKPKIKIITRKPIVPGSEEIENNPRSRSAKLRVAERIN